MTEVGAVVDLVGSGWQGTVLTASAAACEVLVHSASPVDWRREEVALVATSAVRLNEGATLAAKMLRSARRGRQNPVLVAATEACDAELVQKLLRQGALVDECPFWRETWGVKTNRNGDTALALAARQANCARVGIFEALLGAGADVDLPGCSIRGPQHLSARTLLGLHPAHEALGLGHDPAAACKMAGAIEGARRWSRSTQHLFGPNARLAIGAAAAVAAKFLLPLALWQDNVLSFLSRGHWLESDRAANLGPACTVGGAVEMPSAMVAWITRCYFYCDTQAEWLRMQIHLARRLLAVRRQAAWAANWDAELLPWSPRAEPNARLRLEWRHGDWCVAVVHAHLTPFIFRYGPWPPPSPPEIGAAGDSRGHTYVFAASEQETDLVWCGFYIKGKDWLQADKALRGSLAIFGC